MAREVSGSCLCGAIGFKLHLPALVINNCHCTRCRKASGAAFGSYLHTYKDRFEWTNKNADIINFKPTEGDPRPFCSKCGSRVPLIEAEGGVIIPAGTLDGDPEIRPYLNIYVGSKACWFSVSDDLPKFDEEPHQEFWEPIEKAYKEKLDEIEY